MIFKDALSALKEAFEKEIPVPLAYGSPWITTSNARKPASTDGSGIYWKHIGP